MPHPFDSLSVDTVGYRAYGATVVASPQADVIGTNPVPMSALEISYQSKNIPDDG